MFEIVQKEYSLVLIGKDMTKSQFEIDYPDAVGFPHVIIDGEEIGGLQNTAKYLVDKGYGKRLREHPKLL